MGPKSNDKCPLRRKEEQGLRQKRQKRGRPHEDEGRVWSYAAMGRGTPEPPKARRDSREYGLAVTLILTSDIL